MFKNNKKENRMTSQFKFEQNSHVFLSSISIVDFQQVNICQTPLLWLSINTKAERRQRCTVFILNFKEISHFVHVFLLLTLSIYLIARFNLQYFSRFKIKMNYGFIVHSFFERISTKYKISMKWNAHRIPTLLVSD